MEGVSAGAPALRIRKAGVGVVGRPGVEPDREVLGVLLHEPDTAAGVGEYAFDTCASSLVLYAGRNASPLGLIGTARV